MSFLKKNRATCVKSHLWTHLFPESSPLCPANSPKARHKFQGNVSSYKGFFHPFFEETIENNLNQLALNIPLPWERGFSLVLRYPLSCRFSYVTCLPTSSWQNGSHLTEVLVCFSTISFSLSQYLSFKRGHKEIGINPRKSTGSLVATSIYATK